MTKGIKLSQTGTKNIGVANAFQTGGVKAGLLTVIVEVLKVLFPYYFVYTYGSSELVLYISFIATWNYVPYHSEFQRGQRKDSRWAYNVFNSPYPYINSFSFLDNNNTHNIRTMGLKKYIEKRQYSLDILKELSNQPEIKNLDPNYHLSILKKQLIEKGEGANFEKEVNSFIEKFGLLSDSGNDFSKQQWQENRKMIIEMVKSQETIEDKEVKISFLYTNLYQIFRPLFLRLSEIFINENLLDEKEDIFYIKYEKLKKESFTKNEVKTIKEDMKEKESMTLPGTIVGDKVPDHFITQDKSSLKGIPVSNGYYSGKVSIIKGINDFSKVKKGDIIVIPYSDISWNPIFYKAGAIISESGGMLSHSAIIARELGIPAIVSVENVLKILKDDQSVFVDANQGFIETK
jgi:phosphohistidine swiveling domain-containing protein